MKHQVLHKAENPEHNIRGYNEYLMKIVNDTVKAKGINTRNKNLISR